MTNDKRIYEEKNSHNSSLMVILEIIIVTMAPTIQHCIMHKIPVSQQQITVNIFLTKLFIPSCAKKNFHYADYFFHNSRIICPTSRGFLE